MGHTSHCLSSAACAGVHQLCALFDGRDHEAFPHRGRPLFRPASLTLCQTLARACPGGITTLDHLSKRQARQFAKTLHRVHGLPWKIVILIASTMQHRGSLNPENAHTFKHGQGYVIGHQWTNIVLVLGDMLIPLPPIPFYSKRYCQTHHLAYHSEHERVVAYLRTLDLEEY